jgi:hypothetical protein
MIEPCILLCRHVGTQAGQQDANKLQHQAGVHQSV